MFLAILFSLFFHNHDFHFSFAILDFSADEKIIKCSQKVFFDDLELGVSTFLGRPVDLDTVINTSGDSLLHAYLIANLQVDEGKMLMDWVGSEVQGADVVWMYAQIDSRRLPKNMTISSTLLTDVYADQANIILLKNMAYSETRLLFDASSKSIKLERK